MATLAAAIAIPLGVPAQKQPPREVDIGAREAPLSDSEREALARAVAAHNYSAEKAVIDLAEREHPMSAEVLILAGRLAYLEKHPKDAAEALDRASRIKPLSRDDQVTLAIASEATGKGAQAREILSRLAADAPKNPQYPYLLGRFELSDRHLDAASAAFRKAIEADPTFVPAYDELGRADEGMGLLNDARKAFEAAVERNRSQTRPSETPPLDLGALLLKSSELDQAEKLFREALGYNPRAALAYYHLGEVEEARNKHDEAISDYRAAVAHDGRFRQGWIALGREYTRTGRKEDADKCLAIVRKLDEADAAAQASKNRKSIEK
jgi:tetratricopeptide (TPR) repeat protein